MKVTESMVFFARFVTQTIQQQRLQKQLSNAGRKRLRHRLKKLFIRKKEQDVTAVTPSTDEEEWGIMASIRKLNESKQKLVGFGGYDSALLFPAFSYLIVGALFKSIIPHFYSACISCVAAGEANKGKLMLALGGLGLSSVLEALFTGLRGALFWIAGKTAVYCDVYVGTLFVLKVGPCHLQAAEQTTMLESNSIATSYFKKRPSLI